MNEQSELDMMITDLPELEQTDFYRLVMQKGRLSGRAETLLDIGRKLWGPEPTQLADRLGKLEASQLKDLGPIMIDLPNWQAFEDKLPK